LDTSEALTPTNGRRSPAGLTDGPYRLLFDRNPQPMWVFDAETLRFLAVNDAAVRAYGYSRDEFLEMSIRDIRPAEDVPALERRLSGPEPEAMSGEEWRHQLRDGTVIDVLIFAEDLPFDGRRGRLVVAEDITERKRARAELERRASQQSAVAALGAQALESSDASELFDAAASIVASQLDVEFCELLEESEERDALVLRAGTGWHPGLVRRASSPIGSSFHAGFTWGSLGHVIVEDFATETRFRPTPLLREHGVVSGVSVVVGTRARPHAVLGAYSAEPRRFDNEDVNFLKLIAHLLAGAIEHQLAEDTIRHQALHDSLTGLPNRALLLERLNHSVNRTVRGGAAVAVLFVDVDNFKLVNDGFGHAVGDQLLLTIAQRLQEILRPTDTVARVGGDEFVIVYEDVASDPDAVDLAERVLDTFTEPFRVAGREHHVSASVGVALQRGDADPEVLVRDADAAMYLAKERGGEAFELFDAAMRDRTLRWLQTEHELRAALERDELHNVYQPLVASTGRIAGFEALVRWEHPERGTVLPGEFIAVAEQSGLIVPIGEQVLRSACEAAVRWGRSNEADALYVSVNLSPRQVAHPGVVESVATILDETGLAAQRLCLEITETALFDDTESALATLTRLKDLGVGLVLDDFGTGYSSLAYVKRFPIDVLKVDRSFIEGLESDPENEAIVSAVISMGHALGVTVIAEGVETRSQARQLRELGCRYSQGFLYSRPLAPSGVDELLARHRDLTPPAARD
jgi:diguanylate cyclase (GGDEF)-like protein/PAS domain S-box-containing protein